jgi:hypothetical protein
MFIHGEFMSAVFKLNRIQFGSLKEEQFGPVFLSQDEAALFYIEQIKVNPRFDTFFVIDKIVNGKFAVRALAYRPISIMREKLEQMKKEK